VLATRTLMAMPMLFFVDSEANLCFIPFHQTKKHVLCLAQFFLPDRQALLTPEKRPMARVLSWCGIGLQISRASGQVHNMSAGFTGDSCWSRGARFFFIHLWFLLASVTFCAAAETNKNAQLRQLIDDAVGEDTPGLAMAVLQEGGVVFERTRGLACVKSKSRIGADTPFNLASVTKPFTAMAVALLEERGALRYEEALTNIFTGLPPHTHGITVDHLLRHTSGLGDYLQESPRAETNEEVLQGVRRSKKLLFAPGTDYLYSNTGYNLLASVVSQVSGQSYPMYMKKEIFEPLGMSNTWVNTSIEALPSTRAVGYQKQGDHFEVRDYDLTTFGDGAVYCTLNDMKAWCRALDTYRLLRKEKQEQLFTAAMLPGDKKKDYGRGWSLGWAPWGLAIFHGGALDGFRSFICRDPRGNLWIVLLANRSDLNLMEIAGKTLLIMLPPAEWGPGGKR
jgi:CubicO group peptidase (beta-lactamase class C family)